MREPDKSRKSAWWRVRSRLGRALVKDEDGGVLLYMTILIPVMMGIIGLAVDASRLYILNTEQKDLADAAAIAGAWELDGEYVSATDNAIIRAIEAAQNVVTNDPRWASDPEPEAQIVSIRFCEFLTGLPHERTCDGYLEPDLSDSTDSRRAYFIEVITEVRRVFPSFLVAVGAVTEPRSDALAIAGTHLVACNIHSLMICNPYEIEDDPDSPPFTATEGQMFIFKAKNEPGSGAASFAPGDFGLVDHPDHPASGGAGATRDLLSLQSRAICISSVVSPHQGQEVNMVDRGINVRFDEDTFNCSGNCYAEKTAAPHKLRGTTEACTVNNPTYNPAHQYPHDTVINTTDYGALHIGNGVMDTDAKNAYWAHHHGAGSSWPDDVDTRYEAYKRELEMIEDDLWGTEHPPTEDPVPVCLPESEAGAERRILNAAVIDCYKWGVTGNSVNNIRVDSYAEFFITQPAQGGEIYTEFVRMMTPEADESKLKRIVQLYR